MDLVGYFSNIKDYRMVSKYNLLLSDILLIDLFFYLSGGEAYEKMILFAENHSDFVKEYVSFSMEYLLTTLSTEHLVH